MKKYGMLALATIFLLSMSVYAQNQPTPPHWNKGEKKEFKKGEQNPMVSPEKRAERMAKVLGLTTEEQTKVQALFEKQDLNQKDQMGKVKKMREEMKAKFDAQRKANDEELSKIIGQEKFQKLQIMRAERRGEMKGRMKERMHKMKQMHPNYPLQNNHPTPPPAN
jgi:hypothetical protein